MDQCKSLAAQGQPATAQDATRDAQIAPFEQPQPSVISSAQETTTAPNNKSQEGDKPGEKKDEKKVDFFHRGAFVVAPPAYR